MILLIFYYNSPNLEFVLQYTAIFALFSCESDSRIENVRLSVRLSVCQSVSHQNPSASQNHDLSAKSISPYVNQPSCHSATMPTPPLRLTES